jgi:hypothetical protein
MNGAFGSPITLVCEWFSSMITNTCLRCAFALRGDDADAAPPIARAAIPARSTASLLIYLSLPRWCRPDRRRQS